MVRNLPHFFKVRLELAREANHPLGSQAIGYEFVAPLDDQGRIRTDLWKENADACVIRFFTSDAADRRGKLERTVKGEWFFDYDAATSSDDEHGYRFGEERFELGEYVSIADATGKMHTYRVTQVEKP